MGAAASIDASAVPGIKEEYEKKKAEGEFVLAENSAMTCTELRF